LRTFNICPALPAGVALADALCVLDYYGLTLEDPRIIRLDHLDRQGRTLAKGFLKELVLVDKAANFVLDEVERNPRSGTLFLFARRYHDMAYINKENLLGRFHCAEEFVRIGSEQECTEHCEWVEDAYLRELLIDQIRNELPSFDVEYVKFLEPFNCEYIITSYGCGVATRPSCPGMEFTACFDELVVLRVRFPVRNAKTRPRST
jgi:hypothetical protein